MGTARGWWEGTTLVVESGAFKAPTRGASRRHRPIERFTRTTGDVIDYRLTFANPSTWSASWTAALDLKARHDPVGAIVATAAATSFELLRELLTLGTDFVNELGIGRELLP
jgi:hypothetical protein